MQNERRKFIATAGLVLGGVAAGGVQALAFQKSGPEGRVLDVISQYGSSQELTRSESHVTITVKMRSAKHFSNVFNAEKGLPFENIYAGEDNSLSFEHGGTRFTLRNVA